MTTMDPTPAIPAPQLFSLVGQNVLITGATRGVYLFVIYSIFLYFSVFFLSVVPLISILRLSLHLRRSHQRIYEPFIVFLHFSHFLL